MIIIIEKAIIFYVGYLSSNDNSQYLPNVVTSTLKSIVAESDNRMSRLIFKLAVELAMTMNIIASSQDIDKRKQLISTMLSEKINGRGPAGCRSPLPLYKNENMR